MAALQAGGEVLDQSETGSAAFGPVLDTVDQREQEQTGQLTGCGTFSADSRERIKACRRDPFRPELEGHFQAVGKTLDDNTQNSVVRRQETERRAAGFLGRCHQIFAAHLIESSPVSKVLDSAGNGADLPRIVR